MVDVHSHILPGVDDGADSLTESMQMLHTAWKSGVRSIIATPHSNLALYETQQADTLLSQVQRLNLQAAKEKIPITVYGGMEIYADEEMLRQMDEGSLIPLNGSRYYLVEFPFDASSQWISYLLEELLCRKGVVPLIAHPERYDCIQRRPQLLYQWIRKGVLTQINKGSLFGKFGIRAYWTVMDLLEYNLVTCVASDAHTPYLRTTSMEEARVFLTDRYAPEYASQLLETWPAAILENRRIPMRAAARSIEKR